MKQRRREHLYWWEAAFFIDYPDSQHPKLHVDLLIAHRALAPVLDEYGHLIGIWRFHRRAAPDETGHKFTFYFYATRRTARRVLPEIQTHPSIHELKDSGVVLRDQYDDPNKRNPKTRVGDLSDPNWSRKVKEAWPYYAMGISRMLLSLVDECAPGKALAILADESSARGNCLFTAKSPARRAGVTRGVKRAGKGRKVR